MNIPAGQIKRIHQACKYFDCHKAFFGCVVDREESKRIDIYIIPLKETLEINNYIQGRLHLKFSDQYTNLYKKLDNALIIHINYQE